MSVSESLVVDNATSVMKLFGVNKSTVLSWRRGNMPVRDDGRYDLCEIFRWWRDREFAKQQPVKVSSMNELDRRHKELANARQAIKLAKEQNEVVGRAAAMAKVSEMFHRVRARLTAIPEELVTTLPPAARDDVRIELQHRIVLVLRELENYEFDEGHNAKN